LIFPLSDIRRPLTQNQFKILAFAGSIRKGSFNKALIRAAVELAPENVAIEVFDLETFPLFNQDLENTPPPKAAEFKAKIK